MLEIWFSTFVIEAALFVLAFVWKFRRLVASTIALLLFFSSVWLWFKLGFILGIPFILVTVFRILNMMRIVKNRMHEKYLKKTTSRTSLVLFMIYPLLVFVLSIGVVYKTVDKLGLLIYLQLVLAMGILFTTLMNTYKMKYRMPEKYLTDSELPTVTVAVPARNETEELQKCINALLASDYPKLEIIVLDDCSQNRTAEIIKSFAQKGVRFIKGKAPAERWLAKNQAYSQLTNEASGEYIIFCGVDAILGAQSIRSMVNLLKIRNKAMVSILPIRIGSSLPDAFIQPMRYWWEIALPRRLFNKPPVLSTCWMIEKKELLKLGGFDAVSHTIIPEGYFARELVKNDKYSFVRSSEELDVKSTKNFTQQLNSALRIRYPQIRRRPEMALLISFLNMIFLVVPFLILFLNIWYDNMYLLPNLLTCLFLIITHVTIVNITDPTNSLFASVSFPIAVISETVIGLLSMIKYEFYTVEWKDRNICIPVMHVIPRLPKINSK